MFYSYAIVYVAVTETSVEAKITTHKQTANYPHISQSSLSLSTVRAEREGCVHMKAACLDLEISLF